MSDATPPGWYPDAATPGSERWWDGTAWSAHTRPSGAHQAYVPREFGTPLPPAGRPGGGTRTVVMILAGVLVAGAAVTGAVLLGGDDGATKPAAATSGPAPAPEDSASSRAPARGATPSDDPRVLVDQLNGITLPVPEGWEKPDNTLEQATTAMRTGLSYRCPGDAANFCYHGTVTSRTASSTDLTSVEALARADIGTAAKNAYGEDSLGNRAHGGVRSHRELASTSVTVAGRTGHLVRWRVTTGKGPGGYVQSLVFPSAVGSETPVIVRFAFDAGQDGLPLSLMDTITRGIRPVGDSATGGGVGSSVAPLP
ncbi:DUF2510 domain-containing protein [Streptomyces fulvorobeus]|uniref:DUF2510 domain-containing protein n=1 Tax=Streptomyces fulvorobeus TaxID=284028 RepID=A0A7Y9H8I7_9ACTN|nr:DUF2510 domain-containing protein [Streptomyces fulvorobeus]NYE39874.1 hypothetical protein [Streptomyces fulvorobeus]